MRCSKAVLVVFVVGPSIGGCGLVDGLLGMKMQNSMNKSPTYQAKMMATTMSMMAKTDTVAMPCYKSFHF